MPLPSPLELSFLDEVLKLVPPLLGLSLRPLRLHPAAAERLREFCRLRQIEQRARSAAAAASRGAAGAVPWSAPLAGAWGGPSCQVRAGKEARKRAGLRAARIYIYRYIYGLQLPHGVLSRGRTGRESRDWDPGGICLLVQVNARVQRLKPRSLIRWISLVPSGTVPGPGSGPGGGLSHANNCSVRPTLAGPFWREAEQGLKSTLGS